MSVGSFVLALIITGAPVIGAGPSGGDESRPQEVGAAQVDLHAIAAQASKMTSYTFSIRAQAKGLPTQPAPVTGQVAEGLPVHYVQGDLEVYVQGRKIALREGDGDWDLIAFGQNPMLDRMLRAWQGQQGDHRGEGADSGRKHGEAPRKPAKPPSVDARTRAVKLLHVPLPHVVLSQVDKSLEKLDVRKQGEVTVVTAYLNEKARGKLRPLLPGGARARPQSRDNPGWETKARIRLTVRSDGYVIRYDMAVRHTGEFRGRPFDQQLAHTVAITEIGATTLEVPAEVLELLGE